MHKLSNARPAGKFRRTLPSEAAKRVNCVDVATYGDLAADAVCAYNPAAGASSDGFRKPLQIALFPYPTQLYNFERVDFVSIVGPRRSMIWVQSYACRKVDPRTLTRRAAPATCKVSLNGKSSVGECWLQEVHAAIVQSFGPLRAESRRNRSTRPSVDSARSPGDYLSQQRNTRSSALNR